MTPFPWVGELGAGCRGGSGEESLLTHLFQLLLHHTFVHLVHFEVFNLGMDNLQTEAKGMSLNPGGPGDSICLPHLPLPCAWKGRWSLVDTGRVGMPEGMEPRVPGVQLGREGMWDLGRAVPSEVALEELGFMGRPTRREKNTIRG